MKLFDMNRALMGYRVITRNYSDAIVERLIVGKFGNPGYLEFRTKSADGVVTCGINGRLDEFVDNPLDLFMWEPSDVHKGKGFKLCTFDNSTATMLWRFGEAVRTIRFQDSKSSEEIGRDLLNNLEQRGFGIVTLKDMETL